MKRVSLVVAAALLPIPSLLLVVAAAPHSGGAMALAAQRFLGALGPELRAKAALPFDGAARRKWNFVPNVYPGVQLREMDDAQRLAAHELLRSALSSAGYLKAATIMSLDALLRQMEESHGVVSLHDSQNYSFAVFGDPAQATWGWRVQGHHLSLNFTCAGGETVATTPAFLGANPAEIREGPRAGLRPLAAEEDLGYDLLGALDEPQRRRAVIAEAAPQDIALLPGRENDLRDFQGLPWSAMSQPQQALLLALIEEYAHDLKESSAHSQLARIRKAGVEKIHFAWAGSAERGKGHYYRIHGPTFVIELDNTRDGANHVHTVWHDAQNDFGVDLLRQHYQEAHAPERGK